jgi:nucleotide-binding universal stress UspA family protein
MKILLAVDGSKQSLAAVEAFIGHADWFRGKPGVELATVHLPLPAIGGLGAGVSKAQVQKYYDDECEAALAPAKKLLDAARIPYTPRALVGPVAETLVKHARSAGCDLICIGTRGMTATANALLGSTATKLLHLSTLPVLLLR